MSRSRPIECPAGQWTTLVSNFGSGIPRTFAVRFEAPDPGSPVRGQFEEKANWWIFPQPARLGPLAAQMTFHRKWINAIYKIRVRPDDALVAWVD